MARPHKFAWNGIDIETALSVEQLANMAQRASLESTGDMLLGKHRIVGVKSTDRAIEFRINDYLISFKKMLVFTLDLVERGGRTYASTTINWYLTSQTTVAGFIPVSTKAMVAHGTYMQFVRNLAAQVRAADPGARVTMREGVAPAGATGVADAPPQSAAAPPPPPPPPPPAPSVSSVSGFGGPPPPPPPPPSVSSVSALGPPPPPPPPLPAASELSPASPPPAPGRVVPAASPAFTSVVPTGLVTGVPGLPSRPVPAEPPVDGHFDDEDLDSTRMSQASVPRPWVLVLPDGRTVPVGAALVVGRNPSVPSGLPETTLTLPLADATKSVSKSHASIEVRDGIPWITDFNSTNGTTITNTVGEATACAAGTPLPVAQGWRVAFGEYAVTLELANGV